MDYANGQIYQVLNTKTNDIYVGSTCSTLAKRMYEHRYDATNRQERHIHKKMYEIGVSDFYIELIELYPCSCRAELRAREGHYIRERGTLNKSIAGRTDAEYRKDNHETLNEKKKEYARQHKKEISEYYKKWYEINRDTILTNMKETHTCACGKTYTIHHKARHEKSAYHNKQINK